jgi:hypothetical protein
LRRFPAPHWRITDQWPARQRQEWAVDRTQQFLLDGLQRRGVGRSAAEYCTPALSMSRTNCWWNPAAWALRAWKACPCELNTPAIAADTSSLPAAKMFDVGANAAELAVATDDPISARSAAADDRYSGAAVTNDIAAHLLHDGAEQGRGMAIVR